MLLRKKKGKKKRKRKKPQKNNLSSVSMQAKQIFNEG